MPEPNAPITGRDAWAGDVPIGWCRLRPEDDPDLILLVELGNPHPRPVQGLGGGWDVVDRPGRTGLTHWTGHDPMGYEVELFFDDLDAGRSIEGALDVLEAMAGRGKKRTGIEPPVLKVDTGGVMPHDFHSDPDTRWVISGWEEDADDVITNDHGNRIRQTVTVTLLQHVEGERLSSVSANRFLTKRPPKGRYRVREGDNLMTIAQRKLGDASRWREIAQLNGLRDPRSVRQGANIRLP